MPEVIEIEIIDKRSSTGHSIKVGAGVSFERIY